MKCELERVTRGETEVFYRLLGERKLFLNRDISKVVGEGAESAAFLLAAPGGLVSEAEMIRLGLIAEPAKVTVTGPTKISVEVS